MHPSVYMASCLLWLASLFQMFFSLCSVSAACIHVSIYVFGVLFTYRLASLFQMLFSLSSYRHTQTSQICFKAISARTLGLSKTFSVAARQGMHGGNRQTRHHKKGAYYTTCSSVGTLKQARKLLPLHLASMPTVARYNNKCP
jgi:hypothetical protein